MNLRTFIERPILSAVISISIVVVGIIGLFTLPVEQYPDIAPPTIQVSTSYFGASAETLQKSVIAPLEEAINGVENMTYMTSTASNAGVVDITVYFKQGTDPDMAAVNVQNRVSKATGQLPAEVTQVGVTTSKRLVWKEIVNTITNQAAYFIEVDKDEMQNLLQKISDSAEAELTDAYDSVKGELQDLICTEADYQDESFENSMKKAMKRVEAIRSSDEKKAEAGGKENDI